MRTCAKCNETIKDGDEHNIREEILCEDCYIDEIMPRMTKAHYDNENEYMNRLKDSYTVRKQKYH
jgi:hypothetical protein